MLHLLICDQLLTRDCPASRRTVPRSAVGKGEHAAAKLPAMKLLRSAAPAGPTEFLDGDRAWAHVPLPDSPRNEARLSRPEEAVASPYMGTGVQRRDPGPDPLWGPQKEDPGS
jgi:hypothetical protein